MPFWTDVQGVCGSRDGSAIDHSELQYRVPVSEIREPTEAAAQGALRGVTRRNMSGPGSRVRKLAQRLEANDPDRYTTFMGVPRGCPRGGAEQ
jgi:hypothetical protein